jgi:hypothetical protein
MVADIRTIEDYSLSDIVIFDFENFTAADVVKYTLPVLKKIYVVTFVSFKEHPVLRNKYNEISFSVIRRNYMKEESVGIIRYDLDINSCTSITGGFENVMISPVS